MINAPPIDVDVSPPKAIWDDGLAVSTFDLRKSFGAVCAVAGLDLSIGKGGSVAILGPNGAGKSTIISLLLGLLAPDVGRVRLLGRDPTETVAAGQVGAVLQEGGLMAGVRVGELLAMLAGLYRAPMPVALAISMTQLDGLAARRVDRLSGGQTQRLRVATALIGHPELLILDEPTAAMDVESRRAFWTNMRAEVIRGRTIVFSTHYLEEADEFADRVIMIANGRLVADGTPSSIKASMGTRAVSFNLVNPDTNRLAALPGVEKVETHHDRVTIRCRDSDAILRGLLMTWPEAQGIDVGGVSLEDAFVALTTPAASAETGLSKTNEMAS